MLESSRSLGLLLPHKCFRINELAVGEESDQRARAQKRYL